MFLQNVEKSIGCETAPPLEFEQLARRVWRLRGAAEQSKATSKNFFFKALLI
jgi:hypothetical protein